MLETIVMKKDYVERDINLHKGLAAHLAKKEGVYAPYTIFVFSVQQDPVKSAYRVLYDIKEQNGERPTHR